MKSSISKKYLSADAVPLQKRRALWVILSFVAVLLASGGFAWAFSQGYLLDEKPPHVVIVSPSADKELFLPPNGSVEKTVRVAAGDNRRLKEVRLFLNGALVKRFGGNEPFLYKWSGRNPGRYVFHAIAYDMRGNKGESEPVTIILKGQDAERIEGKSIGSQSREEASLRKELPASFFQVQGVKVGDSKERVLQLLGTPEERSEYTEFGWFEVWRYDQVSVYFDGETGKVASLDPESGHGGVSYGEPYEALLAKWGQPDRIVETSYEGSFFAIYERPQGVAWWSVQKGEVRFGGIGEVIAD